MQYLECLEHLYLYEMIIHCVLEFIFKQPPVFYLMTLDLGSLAHSLIHVSWNRHSVQATPGPCTNEHSRFQS